MNARRLIIGCVLSIVITLPLQAATQVNEVWKSFGGNGFFSWEGRQSTAYGESRSREDSEQTYFFSSKPDHRIVIERLDLDKRWSINYRKKRYAEESISEARAAAEKERETRQKEWETQQAKDPKVKQEDPVLRIKRAETTVSGPGALETINGFSSRLFTVKTVIEYESLPDHKPLGTQTMYFKQWTTEDPLLVRYHQERMDYWNTRNAAELGRDQYKDWMSAFTRDLKKAQPNPTVDPLGAYWAGIGKVKGVPVRTLTIFTYPPAKETSSTPEQADTASRQDESLVQPSDLSNGVGGLVSGLATRWASKKIEKKVQDKMMERPSWMDDIAKDLDGEAVIGWGWMEEVISAVDVSSPELFEVPSGFKKVASL